MVQFKFYRAKWHSETTYTLLNISSLYNNYFIVDITNDAHIGCGIYCIKIIIDEPNKITFNDEVYVLDNIKTLSILYNNLDTALALDKLK